MMLLAARPLVFTPLMLAAVVFAGTVSAAIRRLNRFLKIKLKYFW